jgi:SAM-dependent methyltransferase
VKPWLDTGDVQVFHGDCIEVMRSLPDASVDAVVTDPPYELAFMGKRWDATGIAYDLDVWREALRVLKPGGHLLAFGGTRTWHRLAVAIEDAGFDQGQRARLDYPARWMYGSGFPKSLDVSKAIDRKRDDRDDVLRVTGEIARLRDIAGLSNRDLDACFWFCWHGGSLDKYQESVPTVPTVEQWAVLRDMLNPDEWLEAEVWRLNGRKGQPGEAWAEREVVGSKPSSLGGSVAAGERNAEFIAKHKNANAWTSPHPQPPQPNNGKAGAPHSSPRSSRSSWPASR